MAIMIFCPRIFCRRPGGIARRVIAKEAGRAGHLRSRNQAHNRLQGNAFARPGLPHHPEGLALVDVKAEPAHRLEGAVRRRKRHPQLLHLEKAHRRVVASACPFRRRAGQTLISEPYPGLSGGYVCVQAVMDRGQGCVRSPYEGTPATTT